MSANLPAHRADLSLPRTLAGFKGWHAGQSIVVCGCGTSLSLLTEPGRYVTIGVNDVGRQFHPDYLVVVNTRHQFTGDRFRYVEESRARALFSHLDLRTPHPHVVRFQLGRRGGTDFDNPHVLPYTRNSPYVALGLALLMGARRVGLLGVDFTDDHFFARTGRHPLARELGTIDGEYRRLFEACAKRGVELWNLSPSSRLTALPKLELAAFDAKVHPRVHRVVSYATTPVAGVPAVLARAVSHVGQAGRAVWARNGYGNGVVFDGDVEYTRTPGEATALLEAADVVVVHNGKVEPHHQALIDRKPVITLAHNYLWNVEQRYVRRGGPALVVGQYQATLAEFSGWTPVPNPIPLWEPAHQPGPKPSRVTICFTPSGKHERYPVGHRLFWHAKGYATTMRVLERLAKRHDLALEVVRDGQVSHAESLAMKRRSHLVIDECVTGSYHRNSLEGLATGCVVLNHVGGLPGVTEVLRRCAGEDAEVPFVPASLDDLEQVLEGLIALGPAELEARGRRSRAWMERHWDFGDQWRRFWLPAIERASSRSPVTTSRPPPPPPTPTATPPPTPVRVSPPALAASGLTVVIPHGGAERLRNLSVTVSRLQRAGVERVIVVESDEVPRARELVERAGARWVFTPRDGAFHKARVMNVGVTFVTTPFFVWLDADLLINADFLRLAQAELEQRRLDCLVPWTSVRYLGEHDSDAVAAGTKEPADCQPLNTYFTRHGSRGGIVLLRTEWVHRHGGVCEEFRGWGGEDNAFFHKAALLGRAGATNRNDQHTWHLWHPHSGGQGPQQAMATNPDYQRNLALLHEVRTFGARDRFLRRFPPPAALSAPWLGVKRVACSPAVGEQLTQLFGAQVAARALGEPAEVVVEAPGPLAHAELLDLATSWALPPGVTRAAAPRSTGSAPRRVNLGCRGEAAAGFVNVDSGAGPGVDEVADLTRPWPWAESSVDEVRAWDVIEHLPDKRHTMNELWRVLRPGGRVELKVPTTDGPGAFQDPTHVSFWNRGSFRYFEAGHAVRERYAARYGITAQFRVVSERLEPTVDGPRLTLCLEAVKA